MTFNLLVLWSGCEGEQQRPPAPTPLESPEGWLPGGAIGVDSDGDNFPDDRDCAPHDPTVFPGAIERCNGRDDDCDGAPDPIADEDADGDGSVWCLDCDDSEPLVYPGASDTQGDSLDTDCDGTDGEGTLLPAPFRVGETEWRTSGLSLAGGDVDGDGCAELLIGEPGGWGGMGYEDAVVLGIGCHPWEETRSFTTEHRFIGWGTALSTGLIAVHEWGWRWPRGRVLLFDESFGPEATPLLEVLGSGTGHRVDSMALLGDPAQWVLIGSQESLDRDARYLLVDASRRGVLDFEYEAPDLVMETSTELYISGLLGDVGDRDGDGNVDLGLMVDAGTRPLRFFPQVTGGHSDDAPESWSDLQPGPIASQSLVTGADLDGDGLSEAVYASLYGNGEQIAAGRVFLLPWLGPGERDVDIHAPVRIEGEFTYDGLGYDSEIADLDGDGQQDMLVSGHGIFEARGKVMAFLGPFLPGVRTTEDAAVVWVGEQHGDQLGMAIAAGDFDGDGGIDIAIGAPFAERDGLDDAGAVYVLTSPL